MSNQVLMSPQKSAEKGVNNDNIWDPKLLSLTFVLIAYINDGHSKMSLIGVNMISLLFISIPSKMEMQNIFLARHFQVDRNFGSGNVTS